MNEEGYLVICFLFFSIREFRLLCLDQYWTALFIGSWKRRVFTIFFLLLFGLECFGLFLDFLSFSLFGSISDGVLLSVFQSCFLLQTTSPFLSHFITNATAKPAKGSRVNRENGKSVYIRM